jgi:3-oxoacyl-[acyl-carrier-protein] synthase I
VSEVHVVAVGARTPLGLTAESSAAAVRARISRIVEHPFVVDLRGEPVRMALDARLDPGLFGAPRMLELALSALAEVARKLGAAAMRVVDVVVGLPEARAGFSAREAQIIMAGLTSSSPLGSAARFTFSMAGHAGGLEALHIAAERVRAGAPDLCIVGGVDSYVDPDTLLELDANRRLAARTVRSGFPPGEGACFLALAGDAARRSWQLPSLGLVAGGYSARETRPAHADDVNVGEGLTEAIAGAAAELTRRGERVDDIYCDINGERHRTEEWGFALLRTSELWRNPTAYRTAITEWGDMGAASGPRLVNLAIQAGLRAMRPVATA